ncbi:DUF2634 domain-containing protein [Lacticaseibacillus sharpeae]|uniref:Phage protein n=1 Tax=Lacticaseibacillus sharpeae JCM 1186 = DSM 20505 TaxID=1291052 RepID=A0A0R1ZJK1_9LACO|nr:DUF2634 domain-containing protein [Lacticaseibacillus sharpeae]KRM54629.1 hypothetical protein FC18_GL002340 [Lacticaseibacillus sharpeae JCM 1186 = DSM 20505]
MTELMEIEEQTLPSLTYRIVNGRVGGLIDDQDAMRQAVEKILRTERFVWPIYDDQYGNDLLELIGKSMPYARNEVKRMLSDALKADDRVDEVTIDRMEQIDDNSLAVWLTVTTVSGELNVETEVSL